MGTTRFWTWAAVPAWWEPPFGLPARGLSMGWTYPLRCSEKPGSRSLVKGIPSVDRVAIVKTHKKGVTTDADDLL